MIQAKYNDRSYKKKSHCLTREPFPEEKRV